MTIPELCRDETDSSIKYFTKTKTKKMSKLTIVQNVAAATEIITKDVREVFDAIIQEIKFGMAEGEKMEIRGFGTFETKIRKARKAKNLYTGESMNLPETTVIKFRPSKEWQKDLTNKLK